MTQSAERSAIEAAVQQQRFAISAEIHDSLLPYLFVTKMRLESLQHLVTGDPTAASETIADRDQQMTQLIQETIHSVDIAQQIGRNLLSSLDSEQLLENSWNEFLRLTLDRVSTSETKLSIEGIDDESWPSYVRVAVRGVAREAITNAIRHGQATQIQVNLHETEPDRYQLLIKDNGRGFDLAQQTHGYGTRFMHVRAATIGATLAVQSQSGGPTTVSMTW